MRNLAPIAFLAAFPLIAGCGMAAAPGAINPEYASMDDPNPSKDTEKDGPIDSESSDAEDFAMDSGLTLYQVGLEDALTRNVTLAKYVDLSAVLEIRSMMSMSSGSYNIFLSRISDGSDGRLIGSEEPVEIDVRTSYDQHNVWCVPRKLLKPGTAYRLTVEMGDDKHTQVFQTAAAGRAEVGRSDIQLQNDEAFRSALHLQAHSTIHPGDTSHSGESLLNSLRMMATHDDEATDIKDGSRGDLAFRLLIGSDANDDGVPEQEDLSHPPMVLKGEVHGLFVRLEGSFGETSTDTGAPFLTVTGRLRRSTDDTWSLQSGVAVLHTSCSDFQNAMPHSAAKAGPACANDELLVVSPIKGQSVFLPPLQLDSGSLVRQSDASPLAVVSLRKARNIPGCSESDTSSDDCVPASGHVRVQVHAGPAKIADSAENPEMLRLGTQCVDTSSVCFLEWVGVSLPERLPPGFLRATVTLGLQTSHVEVER